MCPECYASAAMLVLGVLSTGGLAALALKVRGIGGKENEFGEVEMSERKSMEEQ